MPAVKNILLVHGAWGDASHWRHVIPPLHAKGYRIAAVQNPLTSLADDVERTRRLAEALEGTDGFYSMGQGEQAGTVDERGEALHLEIQGVLFRPLACHAEVAEQAAQRWFLAQRVLG